MGAGREEGESVEREREAVAMGKKGKEGREGKTQQQASATLE
jgi:hypothetical protein